MGQVTHYYDKLGVAVVDLTAALAIGDQIKIAKDNQTIEQKVESIQVDHKQIDKAKKGDSVGLKVAQPVTNKAIVYKV